MPAPAPRATAAVSVLSLSHQSWLIACTEIYEDIMVCWCFIGEIKGEMGTEQLPTNQHERRSSFKLEAKTLGGGEWRRPPGMLQIGVKLMGMSTKDNATVNLHIMTNWPTWTWETEREALHRVQECCDRSSSVHKEQKGRSSSLCWSKKELLSNNFITF